MAKLPYSQWQESLDKFKNKPLANKITLIYGDCEALIYRTYLQSKSIASQKKYAFTPIDASQLKNAEDYLRLGLETSMFESKIFYYIQNFEQKKETISALEQLLQQKNLSNQIICCCKGDKLTVPLQKITKDPSCLLIACNKPGLNEFTPYVRDLAKECDLELDSLAIADLKEQWQDDWDLINCELKKLSLIFAEEKRILKSADLAKHLGIIAIEHSFKLGDYLMSKNCKGALLHVNSLLQDGESPLGLLAILARNVRNLLKALEFKGNDIELGKELKLPPFIAGRYRQAAKNFSKTNLNALLTRSQLADMELKGALKHGSAELILSDLILSFAQ